MHRRRLPLSGAFDSDVRLQHLADVVGRRCQEGWQALLSIFRFASGPELVRGAARRARSIYSNVHHPAPSAPSSARVMSLRCCQSGLGSCWTAGPAAAQPGFMNVNLVALVIAVASWGLAFFARRQTGFAKKTKASWKTTGYGLHLCGAGVGGDLAPRSFWGSPHSLIATVPGHNSATSGLGPVRALARSWP